MTTTLVIEECPGCVDVERGVRRTAIGWGTAVCGDCGARVTVAKPSPRAEPMPAQRTAPPVATLEPVPDRNRRDRTRPWNLVADMTLLAKHFSAIEGRAQSIEPSVQNGGARDENDRRARERAAAVLIHQRWLATGPKHAAVIEFALIRRDGSKLGDDDEKTTPAAAKARETAFERIAMAFAARPQREAWKSSKTRAVTQGAMRKIGRRLFTAARAAYENGCAK